MSFLWNDQGSSLACMLFAEAVVYGHSMLGFCKRLSTASLNHPPFTFYNARGLRIVKCPLRMKRTSSFVCDCVLEEQSLSVLSLSAKTRHSVLIFVECVVCSFVCVSSMLILCSIRYTAAIDFVFDSLYSGNRFICFDSDCHGQHVLLRKLRQARSCEIWWRREVFGWRSRRIGDAARQSL